METKKREAWMGSPGGNQQSWSVTCSKGRYQISSSGVSLVCPWRRSVWHEMPHVELPFFSSLSFFSWRHFQTTFPFQLGEAMWFLPQTTDGSDVCHFWAWLIKTSCRILLAIFSQPLGEHRRFHCYRAVVLSWGKFSPPFPKSVWQCLGTFLVVTLEECPTGV